MLLDEYIIEFKSGLFNIKPFNDESVIFQSLFTWETAVAEIIPFESIIIEAPSILIPPKTDDDAIGNCKLLLLIL